MYEAGSVMVTIAAVLMWGFVADYARVRWADHPGGRLVMTVLVTLALTLSLVSVRNYAGDFPGHELVRLAVFSIAAVATASAWLLHRRLRRDAKADNPPR